MSDVLRVRLSRLWRVGNDDIPVIEDALDDAMTQVDAVRNRGNLDSAFTIVDNVGEQFQQAFFWFRTTLYVNIGNLEHAAKAVKAVVADYEETDVEMSDSLRQEVETFVEERPEHAP